MVKSKIEEFLECFKSQLYISSYIISVLFCCKCSLFALLHTWGGLVFVSSCVSVDWGTTVILFSFCLVQKPSQRLNGCRCIGGYPEDCLFLLNLMISTACLRYLRYYLRYLCICLTSFRQICLLTRFSKWLSLCGLYFTTAEGFCIKVFHCVGTTTVIQLSLGAVQNLTALFY